MKFFHIIVVAAIGLAALGSRADEIESSAVTEVVRQYFPVDAKGGLAVLCVRDGQVIHKKGYGLKNGEEPVTPYTRMGLASVTKQFAAMCAAILIDEGKLNLDDKVAEYLPELSFPKQGRELLIRDLIYHTSGLANFIKKEEKASIAKFKAERGISLLTNKTHAEWLAEQPLKHPVGTKFLYSNSGYVLLARIIEVISSQPFHEFQQQRIFDNLDMTDTTDSQRFNGSGNMLTTLNNYIKWDRELWQPTLLKKQTADLLFQPGTLNSGEKVDYGFGWRLGYDNNGELVEVFHSGVGSAPASSRNIVLRDLRNRVTVVIFGRENLSLTRSVRREFGAAIRDRVLMSETSSTFRAQLTGLLESMQTTGYQHKTDIVEKAGRYHCDCSGFIGYALRRKFPAHYIALDGKLAPWKVRPLAATFCETIEQAGAEGDGLWRRIPTLRDALPGDLISWRKPELSKGSTTGHVCMILHKATEPDGRYRIRVLDSTNKPHFNDTRTEGVTGIGSGEIFIEVDNDGRPVAFTPRENSKRIDNQLLFIGRLQSGKEAKVVTDPADRDLIGLPEKEARDRVHKSGAGWRVIIRDGNPIPLPLSRKNPDRLNVVIQGGEVIRVQRG